MAPGGKIAKSTLRDRGVLFEKSGEVDLELSACFDDAKSPCGAAAGRWSPINFVYANQPWPGTVSA